MSTTPTVTKEIKLNSKLSEILVKLSEDIKQINNQIAPLNEQAKIKSNEIHSLIAGICLQEGMDLEKEAVYFNETLDTIFVYNKDFEHVQTEEVIPPMKAIKKRKN